MTIFILSIAILVGSGVVIGIVQYMRGFENSKKQKSVYYNFPCPCCGSKLSPEECKMYCIRPNGIDALFSSEINQAVDCNYCGKQIIIGEYVPKWSRENE